MIFSINCVTKKVAFQKPVNLINYDGVAWKWLLTNINFGENLIQSSGFGETGEIKKICFDGKCKLKSTDSKTTKTQNCSDACIYFQDTCYNNNGELCSSFTCSESYFGAACHEYNRISKWKGFESDLTYFNYTFQRLKDTAKSSENCRNGLKQCGYLNKEHDKLCIDSERECPINKIVVKETDTAPTDFNYKRVQLGDKYVFYTNENEAGNLYKGIFADTGINKYYEGYEIIDTDSIYNFIQENPYTYKGEFTKKTDIELKQYGSARLHLAVDLDMPNLVDLEDQQRNYESRTKIYTEKVLQEMNSEVKSLQSLLKGLGIGSFASFAGTGFFLFTIYTSVFGCGYSCKSKEGFFKKMYPMKNIFFFYITFSPAIIFTIVCLLITNSKKNKYKTYYDMEFIDEYKCQNLDNSDCTFLDHESAINSQFVCLSIQCIIIILYPLILSLVYGCCPKEEEPIPKIEIDMINVDKKLDKEEENTGFSSSDVSGGFSSNAQGAGVPYNPGYNQGYNPGYNQGYNPGYGY